MDVLTYVLSQPETSVVVFLGAFVCGAVVVALLGLVSK